MKKYQILKWVVIGSVGLVGFNVPVVSAQEQSSSTREVLNEEIKTEKTIESSDTKVFPNALKLPKKTKEEAIELMSEKTEIEVGQTLQMNAVIMPENSLDKVVTWTSSDDSLATVSKEGLVTAVEAGSVSITVKTQSGQTANRLLTIQEQPKTKTADGMYGTVPWIWEEETATVIFGGGEFPSTRFNGNIWNTSESFEKLKRKKVRHIKFTETVEANVISAYLFANLPDLETIENGSLLNTEHVKYMEHMFFNTTNLTMLDVSKWNTSNVTNMNGMFCNARSLAELDVSEWNMSNVTNMSDMFYEARSLIELDVSKWDTSNVTNMNNMFHSARSLAELDISKWDTSNVTNMYEMFRDVRNVAQLDVSQWDTKNVRDMTMMFSFTKSLTKLDFSHWDIRNVWSMEGMFSSAISLTELDISKWDTSSITDIYGLFMPYLFSNTTVDTLILGENTRLFYNSELPEKNNETYTGRWILVSSDQENSYADSRALVQQYDGSKPGKYIREKRADKIAVTGVESTPKTVDLFVEEETTLQTKITPDNADNKNITYTTSDDSIATVSDNGVVKGIKAGTATITVTTEDGGFQATSTINVSKHSKILIDLFYLGIDEYVIGEVETDLGAKKVQLIVNDEVITTTNVYRNGSFELDTQGMITKRTDKVEVIALDRKNQELERMFVTIEEKSYSLIANPFTLFEDTKVTGQTDYFHTHVALVIDGEEIERKILPSGRQYSFEAEALIEYEDDQVEIVGYRYDSEITRKKVMIQMPVIEMEIDSYAVGQIFVTGKVSGKSANNVRLYVNRRRQQTVKLAEDGTFSLLGISILSPEDKVEVAVLNDQGIEVQRVKVTVTN